VRFTPNFWKSKPIFHMKEYDKRGKDSIIISKKNGFYNWETYKRKNQKGNGMGKSYTKF
jgi:hypothetical protein